MRGPWLALALVVGACDTEDPSAAPDAAVADAGAPDAALDAAPDAAPLDAAPLDAAPLDAATPDAAPADASLSAEDCPRTPAGRCDAVGWITARVAYPAPVDHHTTLVTTAGDRAFLLVFGGIESDSLGGAVTVYDAVRRAEVSGRGAVAAFEDRAPLPRPAAFHAQIILEDQVFLLGGITEDAGGISATTRGLVGRIADGDVGEWRDFPLPAEVRVHPTGVALGQRLYVIGGTAAQGRVLDTVIAADVGDDGLPGPFAEVAPLPAPRSHHASLVVGGHILVLGGFTTGQVPEPDVLRSVHDDAGAVVGWEVVGTLPSTPWTSSTFVHRGWLWLVGGGEGEGAGAHFVDTVRGAPLDAAGVPGAFETFDRPLPLARSHVHQTPVHDGFVYSVGGRVADGNGLRSTNRVLVGELW